MTRIQQLETQNAELERLTITDELTGAYNRRYFDDEIRRTRDGQMFRQSFAFCLFDIDNFKSYNDTHGHAAGDEVLRQIARVTMSQLRYDQDLLFRLGGDEFCMVLSVDSATVALDIVERVRDQVRSLVLPGAHMGNEILAISVGVIWHDSLSIVMPAFQELYLEADRMLYQAKRGGRDRTMISTL
ncbi:GGDEF domain-containing protein [Burkholderia anthina]|uniref:GGDEF domain-containing protein n=1 Tax=Burkholderia anthina TaxID=179879 RepID=UPI00158E838F|nr:GGDEF domain-containing protein [Burkholderia anthina]